MASSFRQMFDLKAKHIYWAMPIVIAIALGLFIYNNVCAYGGGMAARYKDCECMGYEHQLFDQTPADGPRKTVCIGIITETTCYEFLGGPEKACED